MNRWKYFIALILFVFFVTFSISGGVLMVWKFLPKDDKKLPTSNEKVYEVLRTIDGDTIEVIIGENTEKVRFIGVNTPESYPPERKECYGEEAKQYTKHMLEGKSVGLESDATQDERDKYGRLLRYVYLDDEDFNGKLINMGFGFEYTYDRAYRNQEKYRLFMKDAVENEIGMWASTTCQKLYLKKIDL